jgi:hypothetical protein
MIAQAHRAADLAGHGDFCGIGLQHAYLVDLAVLDPDELRGEILSCRCACGA